MMLMLLVYINTNPMSSVMTWSEGRGSDDTAEGGIVMSQLKGG